MAVNFKKTQYKGDFPAIWRGECKVLPGGFAPVQTLPTGIVVHRGTPLFVDFDNMTAAIVKVAKVVAGGTTTAPRVVKGTYLVAGDSVLKLGTETAVTVKSVDTSNDAYDVITFDKAISGLTEGDFLQEAKVVENTASALYDEPNAIVASNLEVKGVGIPTFDAAYDAVVLKNVAYPVPAAWLNGFCLKANPNIIYIKQ